MKFISKVTTSSRLKFDRSDQIVYPFIERRHRHFGASEVEFLDAADGTFSADICLNISAVNPLTDFDLVNEGLQRLPNVHRDVQVEGAIPGTQFSITSGSDKGEGSLVLHATTQERFNTQFNLYKYKRLKMFRILLEKEPDLHTQDIEQIVSVTKRHHRVLALYGVTERSVDDTACPYCGSTDRVALAGNVSQPLIGFVSPDIPLYYKCDQCGLGYMTPHVAADKTALIYDKYDFEDAGTRGVDPSSSPASPKQKLALEMAANYLGDSAAVIDLGGGTGMFSCLAKRLNSNWRVVHSDFEAREQTLLHRYGIETRNLNFSTDPIGDHEYDMVTGFEIIEHLDMHSFASLVARVRRALKPQGLFLFTTPDGDSPLIHAFDFFNAYAPHHILLFGRQWLTRYFSKIENGFDILNVSVGGDLLDDYESYFDYYRDTSRTRQSKAAAAVLGGLLSDQNNRNNLLKNGVGSEVIMLLRRT